MYDTPEGYRDMVTSANRSVEIFMSMGFYIDNTAADDITGVTGSNTAWSNTNQLTNAIYTIDNLAMFEGPGIPTAESAGMIVPPLNLDPNLETGVWSSSISDGSGNTDYSLTIQLSAAHSSALTIYTADANIVAGTVTFNNGNDSEEVSLVPGEEGGYAVIADRYTFSEIVIHITKISEAYKHVKICEIEFGESKTVGLEQLTGEVTYIEEIDPLQVGLPMNELDFNLVNVNGEYDPDNPASSYSRLEIGNPIALSFTISDGNNKVTVPVGAFVIGEKHATELRMSVVAYDIRFLLTHIYTSWSLSTSESLGDTLGNLLSSLDIPVQVKSAVYSVYPVAAYTFSADSTMLDDIQTVAQAYGLTILPDRNGTLVIDVEFPSDGYGNIPVDTMISWPLTSQMNKYNYLDIGYGSGQHYTEDHRASPNVARSVLSIYNPLIVSQAMAEDVADRIGARLYARAMKMEWISDPALSLYDAVGVYSRWTQESTPEVYQPIKRTMTYNGGLSEVTTFIQGAS